MLLGFFLIVFSAMGQQSIMGNFPELAGKEIHLKGFSGFNSYAIDSIKISSTGDFKLKYTATNQGIGYLSIANSKPYFIILSEEDIQLEGDFLKTPKRIKILRGKENKLFNQYIIDHSKRQQVLQAWHYLQKRYRKDSLFTIQKTPQQDIAAEIERIKQSNSTFLKNLEFKSYISWYLPVRNLVNSVSKIVKFNREDIHKTISEFRKLDYSADRLFKSGLLKDAIENQFWLIENIGQPIEIVYKEMSISIDSLLESISKDETKFNRITQHLFKMLEQHSLFQASEYLAVKVLTQNSCTVNDKLAKQLQAYRAMKKGNTAPDINFNGDVFKKGTSIETPSSLSEIGSKYKVVIFGASWCPKCTEEISQLLPLYQKWKSKGVEVLFVSLDTDKEAFKSFTSILPFISTSDYKKWDTKAAKDYYVFATPTIFLLDSNQKILLRPNSVKQLDAWVEYYIK